MKAIKGFVLLALAMVAIVVLVVWWVLMERPHERRVGVDGWRD